MSATYEIEKNAKASKSMSLVVDKVTVSKQDVTTKKELPGATLQIKDSSGNVVDSWVSGTTAHEVSLVPGTYTLVETIANKIIKKTLDFKDIFSQYRQS